MSEQSSETRDHDVPSTELALIPHKTVPEYYQYPTFEDFGGLDDQISRLRDAAMQFEDPEFWAEYEIRRPNGILIVGPGGTGKTQLAKAFAREIQADVREISVSGILDRWVGQTNMNLNGLFSDVAESEGRTVVLFNEFDGLFGNDAIGNTGLANSLVAEMKIIMENLHLTHPNAIVVGTSNSTSGFDSALLRPGRFDLVIQVPKPELEARASIFGKICNQNFELYDYTFSNPECVDVSLLAEMTEDMTGADIASILQAARMRSALHKKRTGKDILITQGNIMQAIRFHRTQRLSGNE